MIYPLGGIQQRMEEEDLNGNKKTHAQQQRHSSNNIITTLANPKVHFVCDASCFYPFNPPTC